MTIERRIVNWSIVLLLMPLMLWSCSPSLSGPEALSDAVLITRSSRLIGLYLEDVTRALGEENPEFLDILESGMRPDEVASVHLPRRTEGNTSSSAYMQMTMRRLRRSSRQLKDL